MNNWMDKLKAFAAMVTAVSVIVGFAYGLIARAGFVISRAEAQTLVDLAVQQTASQVNAAILDEVKARQKADYQFQLDAVNARIQELLDEGDLSKGEEYELDQLKTRAAALAAKIDGL